MVARRAAWAAAGLLGLGAAMGYGSPHTLTDTGVKLKQPGQQGDAPCLRPTVMLFAPAVLGKVMRRRGGRL